MNNDIAQRVREVIAQQVDKDVADVKPESTPDDLEIDSMRMVDIIFSLEEEFDLSIPYNANDTEGSGFKMSKVADVIAFMENLAAENT